MNESMMMSETSGAAFRSVAEAGEKNEEPSCLEGDSCVVFYIVRHGQTEYNLNHLVQGWCDAPLTSEGVRDARRAGRGLARAGVPFVRAYSSDLGRAIKTLDELLAARAEAAPALAAVPCMCDARIREWCYGDLEARPGACMRDALNAGFGRDMPFEELNERLAETADVIKRADVSGKAEGWDDISGRLRSFYRNVARSVASQGGGNVLVVTHSFVIRSTMYLIDPARVNDPVQIANASVTHVVYENGAFSLGEAASVRYLVD